MVSFNDSTTHRTRPRLSRTANSVPSTKAERIKRELETAREILGPENVFGPAEVKVTWGVELAEVPPIPFSKQELENAKELNQMLILRINQTTTGAPLSLEAMNNIIQPQWEARDKGALLFNADSLKRWLGDDYFTTAAPRAGWALVSKELTAGTINQNYLEQTETLIKTLKEQSFKGLVDLPPAYQEAVDEFAAKKASIDALFTSDSKQAAQILSTLKITQLTRQTAPELIYDLAMHHDRHPDHLLPARFTWTASLIPVGLLVNLGRFDAGGVNGSGRNPDNRYDNLGASLSRSGS